MKTLLGSFHPGDVTVEVDAATLRQDVHVCMSKGAV